MGHDPRRRIRNVNPKRCTRLGFCVVEWHFLGLWRPQKSVTRISSGGGDKYGGQVKDAEDNPNQKRYRQIKNVTDKAVSDGSNVHFLGL